MGGGNDQMAYMNQETKARLAVEIAKVMPTNWKYSLKVQNHSTLVLTIRQADVDLIGENICAPRHAHGRPTHINLNEHNLQGEYSGKLLKIFESIKGAMMVGNHDRSDIQSDYFDVGWYTTIAIGAWDSPFVKASTPVQLSDGYKVSHPMPNPLPVCTGMPIGLSREAEIEWMKSRIAQLEGRS
jgi:hypothetical protein